MPRPLSLLSTASRALSLSLRPTASRQIQLQSFRSFASQSSGPQQISSQIKTPPVRETSNATADSVGNRKEGETDPDSKVSKMGQDWPDYSKGPSALDKAAQLFFFTEIVRGECGFQAVKLSSRMGDREIWNHVCVSACVVEEQASSGAKHTPPCWPFQHSVTEWRLQHSILLCFSSNIHTRYLATLATCYG
jgi:hypothetical protein